MTSPVTPGAREDDLSGVARRLLDTIYYLTLATVDPSGAPRTSPLYFTAHDHAELYWVSSPEAQHSTNIARDARAMAVVFDSTVVVGRAEAVYLTGYARQIPETELASRCEVAFTERGGAKAMAPDDLSGDAPLRLYVLEVEQAEALVRASHPTLGTGRDHRVRVDLGGM